MTEIVVSETEYFAVNIVLLVDEDGDYAVGQDEDDARERYDDEVGGDRARHFIHLSIRVPLPRPIHVSGDLPRQKDGSYNLQIAQQ
jgi:hypothetical protein